MKTYTKREFLKMLGLGIAFWPLASCFDLNSDENNSQQTKTPAVGSSSPEPPPVTADDLVWLTRNDTAFAEMNQGFNKRIHHLPKYIAVCKTEAGVQHAIYRARQEQLPIAVKSGGHSFEGFSGNDGGLVINVSQMKAMRWLPEKDEVILEPGCLLEEIQDAGAEHHRLVPAGSCGTVGIAGLTLGGGYGFFSRKYGLTCDSLIGVRMVTADGDVHVAGDGSEILWACRGGGNGSFGVVTSLHFKCYDLPPTFSAYTLKFRDLDATRFGRLLDLWFDRSATLPLSAFSAFVLNGRTLTVLLTNYDEGVAVESYFRQLIDEADTYRRSERQPLPDALKRYRGRKGPIFFKNASAGLFEDRNIFQHCKRGLFDAVAGQPGIIFQVNTLGGAIATGQFDQAGAYPHRRYPYLGELQAYWNEPADEARMVHAFEAIQQILKQAGVTAHYRNYPDINFENWTQAYYGARYPRLCEVKKKLDPNNYFSYPQSIEVAS